ncbi:MAG: preprotein translocase subunit YajC [Pyrinomonadaceae bacterium]|nr:preprotein translocase subunit YajC [Phycisphaerales bacterium]
MTELAHSFPTHMTWLLAQSGSSTGEMFGTQPGTSASGTSGTAPASGTTPPAGAPGGGSSMMLVLAVPLLFLVFMSFWMNKKEKKKRQALMDAVKRNDRVLTIGGIIGTVVELRDDVIVLRIDDNTKTKVEFSRASIQQVIRPSEGGNPDATIETKSKSEKATV